MLRSSGGDTARRRGEIKVVMPMGRAEGEGEGEERPWIAGGVGADASATSIRPIICVGCVSQSVGARVDWRVVSIGVEVRVPIDRTG